jgi:hypothetical protein
LRLTLKTAFARRWTYKRRQPGRPPTTRPRVGNRELPAGVPMTSIWTGHGILAHNLVKIAAMTG